MKKILCILFLLSIYNVFPQKVSELYKSYIPKNVFLDRNNGRAIQDNIDSYVSINPDLLYYYLAYVDNKYKQKIEDPEKNQLNLFNNKLNESLYKRSEWLITQIKENESSAQLCIIKKRIKDFNENYLFEGSQSSSNVNNQGVLVDSNKMNYFNYIYFSRENNLEYDSNIRYIDLINKILKEKIDQLNNDIESLSTPDGTNKEEKITQILDYWYLIGESTYKKYIPSTDKNTVKKIIKAIPNNFAVNYQLLADVKYTVMQVVPKKSFNVVITSKPLENKDMLFDFTLPVEVKLKQRFTFGLGARIPFEKELSAFSYLKLKANFCYLGADVYQPKANKALYTYTYKIESADLHYFYLYKANEVAKLKNYALNLQAYTPILLSAYKLIFNAGLTFVYNSVSFDYSMTIDDYMVNKGVNTLIGTKTVSKNTKENSVTVSPSFLLEYNVIKPINVYTEGIISLKGGIDIMVGLEAALDF